MAHKGSRVGIRGAGREDWFIGECVKELGSGRLLVKFEDGKEAEVAEADAFLVDTKQKEVRRLGV